MINFVSYSCGVEPEARHKRCQYSFYHFKSCMTYLFIFFLFQTSNNIGQCVFWEIGVTERAWLTRGCSRVERESNSRLTTCECNHLTIFAVLMTNKPVRQSEAKAVTVASTCWPTLNTNCIFFERQQTVSFGVLFIAYSYHKVILYVVIYYLFIY